MQCYLVYLYTCFLLRRAVCWCLWLTQNKANFQGPVCHLTYKRCVMDLV
ncbi:hypothetical protein GLYMA_11G153702v4 [Glycine max]|nr:hypothetical protein GLYMA_11G153702v4 [Glycine max]KAH1159565.1 hypothetical protein GYH30_031338 [Glycine max]